MMKPKNILRRLWRLFQMSGRPLLRHGVFVVFMALLMWTTYDIVGEPHTKHLSFYVAQFLFDLYVFCGVLCVMERYGGRWGHRAARVLKYAFYGVSYAVCFVEAFIYMRFYLAFSPTMLNLMLETNGGESTEFVRSCLQSPKFGEAARLYGSILAANIVCGRWGHSLYAACCRWMLRERSVWSLKRIVGRCLRAGLFPMMAITLLSTTLVPWAKEKQKMIGYMFISETTQAERVTGNVFYSPFLRIVYSLKFVQVVRKDTERLVERMNHVSAAPGLMCDSTASRPIIVLVVGESYNKHHASCYGYSHPTTPGADRLQREGSLTVFTDAVSPWNVTSNAFKSMLSTHSTDQSGAWTDGVLFPAIFRRGGYNVAFITNQFYKSKRQNRSDFNGSFFLNDPRLDTLCFDYRNTRHYKHDGQLLQEVARHLDKRHGQRNEGSLCIVHFMGQHVLYSERFPASERHFTPADYTRPDLSEKELQVVADYDNATRYNDKVFTDLLQYFRRDDAIVIYLADHGDEVYDKGIGMFGRNHTADLTPEVLRGEFEVPMMVWTSPRFIRRHPAIVSAIKTAASLPFSTDDIPHLLLGLSAITTPYYDAQRDLLAPCYNPQRPRPIKDIANYDDIMRQAKR